MSIQLSDLILHQLKRTTEQIELILAKESLPINTESLDLVEELHQIYMGKPNKGFAFFDSSSSFSVKLDDWQQQRNDFLVFSKEVITLLQQELLKYQLIDQATLVLAHYQSFTTEYLLIALLPTKQSIKVTQHLDLCATEYLNLDKLDLAVRLDLTAWQTDRHSKRYLSFIKGRVGRKIADFFLDFMQAQEGMDQKQQNQTLVQAVEDFCIDVQLDKEEKQQTKQQVYQYCQQQLKNNDEVDINALSQQLPSKDNGTTFELFTQQKGYELEAQFPADRSTLKVLAKYTGVGGGVSLSFDQQLLGDRVFYDSDKDILTIQDIPPNLRDQLLRSLTQKEVL